MFQLSCTGWSFDPGLQIIHADVRMVAGGTVIIDEPLCVDVGMPALLLSAMEATDSNRWSETVRWEQKPFFCCGCGDPECRAFSFRVRHEAGTVQMMELDERENAEPRELDEHAIEAGEYSATVLAVGKQFLAFVEALDDYRPMFPETVAVVRDLVRRLELQG